MRSSKLHLLLIVKEKSSPYTMLLKTAAAIVLLIASARAIDVPDLPPCAVRVIRTHYMSDC